MPSWTQIAGIAGIVLCMGITLAMILNWARCAETRTESYICGVLLIVWFWITAGLIATAIW